MMRDSRHVLQPPVVAESLFRLLSSVNVLRQRCRMATQDTIDALKALLDSGATSAVVDGQTVTVDHGSIRQRIRDLEAGDSAVTRRRPLMSKLNLSGVDAT